METEHRRTTPAKHVRAQWQKHTTRTRAQHEHPNTALRTECSNYRWRPYRVECTGSLPTSEVKRRRARLVLGWGTAREDLRVLPALYTPHTTPKHRALKPKRQRNGALVIAGGHTASNAPDLFRPPKLSGATPGSWWVPIPQEACLPPP
jgi:hypothetical protein